MTGIVALVSNLGGDTAVVVLLVMLLVPAAAAAFAAFAPANPLTARLFSVTGRQFGQVTEMSDRKRAMRSMRGLRQLVERLKLTRGADAQRSADLLLQAGWRTSEALVVYSSIRLALPIVLAVVALVVASPFDLAVVPKLGIGIAAALAGLHAPAYVLRRFVVARHRLLNDALPDALDLLVICAESGLGLDGALNRVARELARFQPEMAEELHFTGLELGFLPNRRDAFQNLLKRVDIPSMRSFVNTLIQTERYGTPLAQALRLLSGEMREERMLRAEEKAARLPAVMTVPMIVFILPAMFMLLIGPAIVDIIKSFQ
jgi:tight adherence protein C